MEGRGGERRRMMAVYTLRPVAGRGGKAGRVGGEGDVEEGGGKGEEESGHAEHVAAETRTSRLAGSTIHHAIITPSGPAAARTFVLLRQLTSPWPAPLVPLYFSDSLLHHGRPRSYLCTSPTAYFTLAGPARTFVLLRQLTSPWRAPLVPLYFSDSLTMAGGAQSADTMRMLEGEAPRLTMSSMTWSHTSVGIVGMLES